MLKQLIGSKVPGVVVNVDVVEVVVEAVVVVVVVVVVAGAKKQNKIGCYWIVKEFRLVIQTFEIIFDKTMYLPHRQQPGVVVDGHKDAR